MVLYHMGVRCSDGYKYDSSTKSCVSLNACEHNVCASYSSVMICGSDGQWQGTQVCNSGVAHAEDYCQNDDCVHECEEMTWMKIIMIHTKLPTHAIKFTCVCNL